MNVLWLKFGSHRLLEELWTTQPGGLDLTPHPGLNGRLGVSGFSPQVLVMSADPPLRSKKEWRRSSRQMRWGLTGVLYDPASLFPHMHPAEHPFPQGGFSSPTTAPQLRLRELSEAQGRDKGHSIPQDCSCWLGSQEAHPLPSAPHRYKPDTGYLHPQALERSRVWGEADDRGRRPSISDKPSATVVRL